MKLGIFLIVILSLVSNQLLAFTITGRVSDDQNPLPGAVITRTGTEGDVAYAVTDINGKYSIEGGPGKDVFLMASFVGYVSDIKQVNGGTVYFELEKVPDVPVSFFTELLTNSKVLAHMMRPKLQEMGASGMHIFIEDNTLVISIGTKNDIGSDRNIRAWGTTTMKDYLRQLKSQGRLDGFINQMQGSGMKWGFAIYDMNSKNWRYSERFDASQIKQMAE